MIIQRYRDKYEYEYYQNLITSSLVAHDTVKKKHKGKVGILMINLIFFSGTLLKSVV